MKNTSRPRLPVVVPLGTHPWGLELDDPACDVALEARTLEARTLEARTQRFERSSEPGGPPSREVLWVEYACRPVPRTPPPSPGRYTQIYGRSPRRADRPK